jgi:catechol 2,3-dioxygenase-like lactoylglutathione lyase family enzyme
MEFRGINHLALVCRDMDETVGFYRDRLGMPLVKTVALPDGGQHFFFDCGGGNCVAFFWWPDAKLHAHHAGTASAVAVRPNGLGRVADAWRVLGIEEGERTYRASERHDRDRTRKRLFDRG